MGKPSTSNVVLLITEYIGYEEGTRRTETSQYPEEKKSTEIPLVAASETGWAETYLFPAFGQVFLSNYREGCKVSTLLYHREKLVSF